jgi:ABC-type multidrug transport system ATPase subunit
MDDFRFNFEIFMINITNLSKVYSGVKVLDIPELIITAGESFGLVGNNGAGKTTMFRLILDLIRPQSGYVLSKGQDVSKNESWKYYTGSYLDRNFLIDFDGTVENDSIHFRTAFLPFSSLLFLNIYSQPAL